MVSSWAKLNIKCHCVGVSLTVEYGTQWSVRVASGRVAIAKTKIATLPDATANTSYPTERLRQRDDELSYIYLDASNL
ncbi:hypothetical protein PQG02_07515 [Nostoc sp. UHCC 0926]|uniref:hypothetical protein n=1 Tax=Nostoc sp. TaxID=1180 RepID=UPI00279F8032|nr:hypothetical protein PQG02_07515 [Nostoc sp. UHCC 0926]